MLVGEVEQQFVDAGLQFLNTRVELCEFRIPAGARRIGGDVRAFLSPSLVAATGRFLQLQLRFIP
jgi:hypothetical protein